MKGRNFKFFLPIFIGLITFVVGVFSFSKINPVNAQAPSYGSITVCKVIADENGNLVDGSTKSGVTFTVPGITPAQTSGGAPVGQIGDSQFTTPLTFNANIFGSNDGQCVTYSNLAIGGFYYGQETINPSAGWEAPKYNDQFSTPVTSLADFFSYDSNLFDGNSGNDSSRNKNADGHIILTSQRPDRTLIVLNKIQASPAIGGPSVSGNVTTPQCPPNGPQKVDQIWFSNVQPSEVTVHWANKGDAHSYHIAYGPAANNLPWGVVVPGNLSQFTLTSLPGGSLWVQIIAKVSADCGGPSSDPTEVGKGQVLGVTTLAEAGTITNSLVFLSGFGLLILGLWQTKKALLLRERKISK